MSKNKTKNEEPEQVIQPVFNPDTKTYAAAWNESFNRFDLLILTIQSSIEEVRIQREATRFTHDYQIHAEIIKRMNDDFMKKGRKK